MAGDKSGNWIAWYKEAVAEAEKAYAEHPKINSQLPEQPAMPVHVWNPDDDINDENRERIAAHKERMLAQARAHRLSEARRPENSGWTELRK